MCCLIGFWVISFAQKPIVFREQLAFEYQKEGKKAEFSVYLDRKTSTWLFTNADSFDGIAEGLDFLIGYPNGTYLVCGTDDVSHQFCQKIDSPLARKHVPKISGKATGKSQTFGQNKYGWPVLKGLGYKFTAGRAEQEAYLAAVNFNCNPLYALNFLLDLEFHLPAINQIDYPSYLPKNQLVVQESGPQGFKLVSISPTEYFVDLKAYKAVTKSK